MFESRIVRYQLIIRHVYFFVFLIKFFRLFLRHYGIPDNHRILDARKGPVKKTAAIKTLPKIQNLVTPGSADSILVEKTKSKNKFHKKKFEDERNGASTN